MNRFIGKESIHIQSLLHLNRFIGDESIQNREKFLRYPFCFCIIPLYIISASLNRGGGQFSAWIFKLKWMCKKIREREWDLPRQYGCGVLVRRGERRRWWEMRDWEWAGDGSERVNERERERERVWKREREKWERRNWIDYVKLKFESIHERHESIQEKIDSESRCQAYPRRFVMNRFRGEKSIHWWIDSLWVNRFTRYL